MSDLSSQHPEPLISPSAAISSLVSTIEERAARSGGQIARELIAWAETLTQEGRALEAEFLYLQAINRSPQNMLRCFPFQFKSLKQLATSLLGTPDAESVSPTQSDRAYNSAS